MVACELDIPTPHYKRTDGDLATGSCDSLGSNRPSYYSLEGPSSLSPAVMFPAESWINHDAPVPGIGTPFHAYPSQVLS